MNSPAPLVSPPPASSAGPLTFGHVARVLWQRKWPALVMAIVVGCVVHYASSFIVPQYLATATLRLDSSGRGNVMEGSGAAEQTLLNTQRDLLMSSKVLRRAYATGPLSASLVYQDSANPVELLASRLGVDVSRDSWRIAVSLRDEDPERAQRALDGLIAAFLNEQAAQQVERTANELSFHTEQVELAREKLNQARVRDRELRERHALISANPEDNFAAVRLATFNAQRTSLDQRLAVNEAVLVQLRTVDRDHPFMPSSDIQPARSEALLAITELARDPLVIDLRRSLADLRAEEARLSPIYLPKHPKMKEVLDALAFKQGELGKAVESSRIRLLGEREVLDRESASLDQQITEAKAALTSYRNAQLEMQAQAEETRTQEVLFQQALAQLSEKQLTSRREGAKMAPMDPAQALPLPVNIKPRTFLAVAIAVGLLAGIGLALGLDALDQRVRSHAVAEDLTRLPLIGRLPLLGHLPNIKEGASAPEFQPFQEAYRDLRTALRLYRRGDGCQVIGVLSCGPGEGKTTIAAFLATSLAEANIRVLLIDGDLRRPTLHTVMDEDGDRGLGSLLSGDASDCVPMPTTLPKLDFMGAGRGLANPAELLHSRQLPELMAQWRTLYDYIIIDTSPLGLVSDALLFCEHADDLLWVVRDQVSRKDVLRQVREVLAPLAGRLLGCVYNGDASYRSRYGYGHMSYGASSVDAGTPLASRG